MGAFLPNRRKTRPVSHSFLCLAFFFFLLAISTWGWITACLSSFGVLDVFHRGVGSSHRASLCAHLRFYIGIRILLDAGVHLGPPPAPRYGAGSHTARICTRKYSHSESTKVYHAVPPALSTGVWCCISIVRIWWRCRKSHGRSNQSAKQHMPADHTGQGW